MSQREINFHPFDLQEDFLYDPHRIKGAFAGKRGGKTEVGAVNAIMLQENKPNLNYFGGGIDPYLGLIVAPTTFMLETLSLKKFLAYAGGAIIDHHQSKNIITWHDDATTPGGSKIYGLSADKPQRMEGQKVGWIWLDEVFQMSEQTFLEARTRVADTRGFVFCTGSLGVQYVNPKQHWAYKYFKLNPDENTKCFEWATAQNPYFPKEEIESLKNSLDPRTFRQMFEIDWDITPTNAVYSDFDEANITRGYSYDPALETFVAIDWGFAHPMACLYFQYDRTKDIVYLFDEIVMSGMTLDKLWSIMASKPYKISGYCCDIAGNQEREQTGIANIRWFFDNHQIKFKYGAYKILPGIAFVRSYIKNGKGQSKMIIDEVRCPKSLDSVKQYKYPVKNGIISNENPEKLMDDAADAIRYFFMNFIKPRKPMTIEIG